MKRKVLLLMVVLLSVVTGARAADGTYNPSVPVVISGFTPESGSAAQQVVISGSNFGNDVDKVSVTIGEKSAVLASVADNIIYCYVPSGAFTGVVEVTVGDDETGRQTARASKRFNYERRMVVGKLCGYKNEADDQGWKDGTFDECAGFRNDGVMQFSPYNRDQLFVVYDQEPYFSKTAHGIQLVDLKERTVQTVLPLSVFDNQRLRTIDFCVDPFAYDESGNLLGRTNEEWTATATAEQLRWKEHLIVAADNDDADFRANSVYIVDRDADGNFSEESVVTPLANYRQCNSAAVHPNGDLYFTSYAHGEVVRLDMNTYWNCVEALKTGNPDATEWNPFVKDNVSGAFKVLFNVGRDYSECQFDIHPTGKYAYIVVVNQQCILRSDYDEAAGEFLPPHLVAGSPYRKGFVDGTGEEARLARPYQGIFVKNGEYEKEGEEDVYDFFFSDNSLYPSHDISVKMEAHALRVLTPDGYVETYAGGNMNTHDDGKPYGSENGELRDEARFDRPTGIACDVHIDALTGESTRIFYILDTMNRCIRTITLEEPESKTTGINAIHNEKCIMHNATNAVYDLQGRKVADNPSSFISHPSSKPGIYIKNGRKIVVK